ncbi:hypothetical protein [Haloplanus halophilus]|uniref:hypothetical protein n=1 Tax=Haloplanus halophilus TaxID=2949993 RepID=UPI00203DB902|nr:hypothetical protein [Haloplanus sp. GDY1]
MPSSERFLRALLLSAVPAAVAVALGPPDPYAWIVVGLGVLLGVLPSAYLLAGAFARD